MPRDAWTLERFGLTPSKLWERLVERQAPRVLCVSIPKAGTHLLERALCLHPQLYRKLLPTLTNSSLQRRDGIDGLLATVRPGQVIASHLRFDGAFPEAADRRHVPVIFLVRDPRDLVISQVNYVARRSDHRFNPLFAQTDGLRRKLELAIVGDREHGLRSVGERLEVYAGWLRSNALVVRFEDLVGPGGGGDADRQAETVRTIYRHIRLPVDEVFVSSLCGRLFSSDSPTFRRGAIGQWRDLFDDELGDLFERTAGDMMRAYGYGADEG
ncbi:MAG: sulfotransferase domain-containing protein [Actinomycetota bacterium]